MPTDTQSEELKGYWDELHSLSIGNPCTCGAMHESNETHKLIQFLSGLNDSYSTVRSSILMIVPVPSVEKAYSILIRDEKQKEVYSDCLVFSPDSVSCSASSSSNSRIHPSSQSTNRSFNLSIRGSILILNGMILSANIARSPVILLTSVLNFMVSHLSSSSPKVNGSLHALKWRLLPILLPHLILLRLIHLHMVFLRNNMIIS